MNETFYLDLLFYYKNRKVEISVLTKNIVFSSYNNYYKDFINQYDKKGSLR